MGFIRHNMWFVLFLTAMVTGIGVLSWALWVTKQKNTARQATVKQQIEFMQTVEKGSYTVGRRNVEAAKKNRELTGEAFNGFLAGLANNYGFPAGKMKGLTCVAALQDATVSWNRELTQKGVAVLAEAQDFSYGPTFKSTVPPNENDTERLLKQVKMIGEMVRILGEAGSGIQLVRLERQGVGTAAPPLKDGLYRVESFELGVQCHYDSLVKLCNSLQREANGIFILRSLDVQSQLQGIESGAATEKGKEAKALDNQRSARPVGVRAPTEQAEKESRVAFKPYQVQALLLLDVIEFAGPKPAGGA